MRMKEQIIHLLYTLFRVFPIRKNRIVFSSFDNTLYGGNPRVITEALLKVKNVEAIWILNPDVDVELPSAIKRVSSHSLKKIYYYSTAKIWVDSHHFYNRWKRKNQYLIQTWHAALPLKKIEGEVPQYFSPEHIRQVRRCSEMTDYQISNSDKATEILRDGMWYTGPVIQVGMPVNDILVNQNTELVLNKLDELGLNKKNKYILYAPTCRQSDTEDKVNALDYERVTNAFRKRFGGEWKVLYRGHPIADSKQKEELLNPEVIDVTKIQLISDLLVIADAVITDYSSTVTDFMITRRPAFLYTYDYNIYKLKRDFMFSLEELPFPLAKNNETLEEQILAFDDSKYQSDIDRLFMKWNLKETGEATMTLLNVLIYIMFGRGNT